MTDTTTIRDVILNEAIEAWRDMLDRLQAGELTDDGEFYAEQERSGATLLGQVVSIPEPPIAEAVSGEYGRDHIATFSDGRVAVWGGERMIAGRLMREIDVISPTDV